MQQAPKRTIITIPEPAESVHSLLRTTKALKQAVEQIMGVLPAKGGPEPDTKNKPERKPSIFITDIPIPPDGAVEGDFWLFKGGLGATLYILSGTWLAIFP